MVVLASFSFILYQNGSLLLQTMSSDSFSQNTDIYSFCSFLFGDTVLLCSYGWPGTHYVGPGWPQT